jgi:hypothetical protein
MATREASHDHATHHHNQKERPLDVMGRSRKIRHRAKLIKQTKPPIRARALGLGNESMSAHNRIELAERHVRLREQRDAEFHAMSRKEPPHLPIDRTPLEHEVITLWSRRMHFDILKAIRGKAEFRLIVKGQNPNGKVAATSNRPAERITSFGELARALSLRSEASADCEG